MLTTSEILELQKLCKRSFPERLEQRVSQPVLRTGAQQATLSFSLSWQEGPHPRVERLVVRRHTVNWTRWRVGPDGPGGLDRGEKARREWTVMRWLYSQGLPILPVYALSDDALLMPKVSGREAASDQARGVWIVEPHIDEFARLLSRLHGLTPPGNVRDVLPVVTVVQQLERFLTITRRWYDGGLGEAAMELRLLFQAEEELPPCVLCGTDIFATALLDARGITALSNWDNSALGDPRWDVALASNWLRAHQADGLADRFLAAYQNRIGHALAGGDAWAALAAAHNWALATWLRENAPEHQLASQREMWIELTWRALTRCRYNEQAQDG